MQTGRAKPPGLKVHDYPPPRLNADDLALPVRQAILAPVDEDGAGEGPRERLVAGPLDRDGSGLRIDGVSGRAAEHAAEGQDTAMEHALRPGLSKACEDGKGQEKEGIFAEGVAAVEARMKANVEDLNKQQAAIGFSLW
jgi:hypothetical protein